MERRRDNAAIPKNADWVLHIGLVIVLEDSIVAEELPPYGVTSESLNILEGCVWGRNLGDAIFICGCMYAQEPIEIERM